MFIVAAMVLCVSCSKEDLGGSPDSLFGILLNGSEYEVTEANVPDWQGLGVYCVLTNGNLQQLGIMDGGVIVKDADAELYSEGSLAGKFVFDAQASLYTLNYTPEPGNEYVLKLSYNGKTVEAKAVMPCAVEREFVCNPVLVPMVYRESAFLDPESGFADEDYFYRLFDEYPSYTLKSEDKESVVYSYFKEGEGIVDQLFSTHANTHGFNKTDDCFTFKYMAVKSPEKVEGNSNRTILDNVYWKEVKYNYCKAMARVELDEQTVNPYHLASYVSASDSSPELSSEELYYVVELVTENPQYSYLDKKCEFWGPDFFIMPYCEKGSKVTEEADKQVVMSVSDELDLYLMNCRDFDFDDLADIRSNFTNIAGGYGVFGAAHVEEYDFSTYYEELRDAYFNIIGSLEKMPPVGYANYEYGKYW